MSAFDHVRDRILMDHEMLREELERIESMIGSMNSGAKNAGTALRAYALRFQAHLRQHMDFEDSLLPAVLDDGSHANSARAQRQANDHAAQRELLDGMLERLRSPLGTHNAALEEHLVQLISMVREDMQHEEHEMQQRRAFARTSS